MTPHAVLNVVRFEGFKLHQPRGHSGIWFIVCAALAIGARVPAFPSSTSCLPCS